MKRGTELFNIGGLLSQASSALSSPQAFAGFAKNTITGMAGNIIGQAMSGIGGGGGGGGGMGGSSGGMGAMSSGPPVDHRVRVRARPGAEDSIYGSGPAAILHNTNGLVFPYTPQIQYAQTVNYSALNLVHINQDYQYYSSTQNLTLMIAGVFTAQNQAQAAYCYGAIHFLRTVTKMHFGENDPKRGLPPPVLVLDGYGDHMFNQLPIIITNFSIELQSEIDYVQISVGSGDAWIPTQFNIALTCMVQNPPEQWRTEFDLEAFRNGQMLGSTKGWV